jgi:hypothetical protein
MSVDLSGEITAIATAVLAAFAIITAVVAYMAFADSPGKSPSSSSNTNVT